MLVDRPVKGKLADQDPHGDQGRAQEAARRDPCADGMAADRPSIRSRGCVGGDQRGDGDGAELERGQAEDVDVTGEPVQEEDVDGKGERAAEDERLAAADPEPAVARTTSQ